MWARKAGYKIEISSINQTRKRRSTDDNHSDSSNSDDDESPPKMRKKNKGTEDQVEKKMIIQTLLTPATVVHQVQATQVVQIHGQQF